MNLRFYMDRHAGEPHCVRYRLSEEDVRDVLAGPLEDHPGRKVLGRLWVEGMKGGI